MELMARFHLTAMCISFQRWTNHGVLSKLSKLYSFKTPLTIALAATDVVLIVLLLLINLKNKLVVYYWAGTSALVSAILGLTPSVHLAVDQVL